MSIVKDVLAVTVDLREKYEKRSDPRNYQDSYDGKLTLPSTSDTWKISLGYLERFLLKADSEGIDNGAETGTLVIDKWNEGCGFFGGQYSVFNGDSVIKSGSFEWAGQGKIDDTWDMFSRFG